MPVTSKAGWIEPTITIEGQELTVGQAMALRVAVGAFYTQLTYGDLKDLKEPIFYGYRERVAELVRMMVPQS